MNDTLILPQENDNEITIDYSKLTRCFVFQQGRNQIILTFEEMDQLMDFAGWRV